MKRPAIRKQKIPPPMLRRKKCDPSMRGKSWLADNPAYFERNHGSAPTATQQESEEAAENQLAEGEK